ncbi:hypothetical protein GUJ93_ZPchr0003g18380 [Zizania palustris]|uniref:Uncharacterized protein n=1 Tax=Zizania palustris TaxID=103762 RepID=A0A8J5S7Z6_ZIZPA|nr:hypothetical protein GUJ93_ZPchr0003g18380 [Zizania palustris]
MGCDAVVSAEEGMMQVCGRVAARIAQGAAGRVTAVNKCSEWLLLPERMKMRQQPDRGKWRCPCSGE